MHGTETFSPRRATVVVAAVLAFGCLAFALLIDRYPAPYVDEPFYNYAAVRYLKGKGLTYPVNSQAPFADQLWSYHAPFFPRLQVVTFKLFGITQAAARLPQLLLAHVAAFILCLHLIRRRMGKAAVVLAVAWLGDRAGQEVLYARMEGIALFFVALGFVALDEAVRHQRPALRFATGLCLCTAIGFHPITAVFSVAAAVLVLCTAARSRIAALLQLTLGAMIPLVLIVGCLLPNLSGAIAQFRWNLHLTHVNGEELPRRWANLVEVLRWSRWFFLWECAATAVLVLPLGLSRLVRERGAPLRDPERSTWLVATAFAGAGLACLLTRAVLPYYLVYFTLWALVASAVVWENNLLGRWGTPVLLSGVLCWLPSLAWSGLRLREAVQFRRELDPRATMRRLAEVVPRDRTVWVDPVLFLYAEGAGLSYELLSWYKEPIRLPSGAIILLKEDSWNDRALLYPGDRALPEVVATIAAHPGARLLDFKIVVLRSTGEPR